MGVRSPWRERRSWAGGAVLLAVLSSIARAQAEPVEPIRVEFEAPRGCPDVAAFVEQVRARTARARPAIPGERARTFAVTIARGARDVRGRLTIDDPPGPSAVREVAGGDCRDVVSALALITALAVDPRASTAPRARLPAPPLPAVHEGPALGPPPAPALPPPPAPAPAWWLARPAWRPAPAAAPRAPLHAPAPDHPPIWRFAVGVHVGTAGAIAPTPAPEIQGFIEAARLGSSVLSPTLRLGLIGAQGSLSSINPAGARFRWTAARMEGCPLRFVPTAALHLTPCALLDAGGFQAEAWGPTTTYSSHVRPWVAPGLLGRVGWDVGALVLVEVEAGATFPLLQDAFYLSPSLEIYRTPAAAVSLGGGVGLRFF